MGDWFTVLASGSGGNACLLEADGFGLLIDCGLGPRILAERLSAVGRSWRSVSAVLLTHTHSDHWHRLTLAHLRRHNIPLVVHHRHQRVLSGRDEFDSLRRAGLIREFKEGVAVSLSPGLFALPVEVPHDSDPTFAFRFRRDLRSHGGWSLGLASDVGHVTAELVRAFAGVDVLAVEFNHDIQMQRASGRPAVLINRVLGKYGHLSNSQGAELTSSVIRSSAPGVLRHLVQLHLSRDCNTLNLASRAGQEVLDREAPSAGLTTASQHLPTTPLLLTCHPEAGSPTGPDAPRRSVQLKIPGMDHV